ncbi:MAG: ABC transporter ATP-binding protein [Candidatus Paceibacterota bacterium]|jgi:putative ABC transport system ATP-binding protein|nr:ABC transporter ATP-binding protein [Candidatus Paceibacterota bacterium]
MDPVIKLEDVRKTYQLGKVELEAVRGISLEINPGAFVTIMGPSGSGKSTLLNMIGCLDVPSGGKIFLKGKDVTKMTETQLAQLRGRTIGFIFQEFNLIPNLTALENVTLPMIFQGKSEEERKRRGAELLSSLGLKDRIKHQPAELSGGERQRVAIARAFANDPEVVIADEPTGNLDSTTGKKIMEVLTNFHNKEGKTIVVVTHDPNIAGYSEELVNIKDGQIVKNHVQAQKSVWEK